MPANFDGTLLSFADFSRTAVLTDEEFAQQKARLLEAL
jgi:hypothetical protein